VRTTGRVLHHLGVLSVSGGNLRDAEGLFTAALEAKHRCGASDLERAQTLLDLAGIAVETCRFAEAAVSARQVDGMPRIRAYPHIAAAAASIQALAALRLDQPAETALAAASRAGRLVGDPGDNRRAVECL
jgi:hypothetical protein